MVSLNTSQKRDPSVKRLKISHYGQYKVRQIENKLSNQDEEIKTMIVSDTKTFAHSIAVLLLQ